MLTREDTRRVQGELAMAGDAWVVIVGGIKLQRRKARVNPSTMERGSSSDAEMAGTSGKASINAWIAA